MEQNSFVEGQGQQGAVTPTVSQTQAAEAPKTLTQAEKMLPQSEVNSLVGRVKAEAEEKGRQRALQEMNTTAPTPAGSQPSLIGGITQEDIRRIAAEELKNQRAQEDQARTTEQGHKILNELMTKFEGAKGKYEDFDKKVAPYFNQRNGVAFGLANQFDNTADIAYEMASRPDVLERVTAAFSAGGPHAAYQIMSDLSHSIKLNQQVANIKTPNEPLSQIKSSPVGSNNGSESIEDRMRALSRDR